MGKRYTITTEKEFKSHGINIDPDALTVHMKLKADEITSKKSGETSRFIQGYATTSDVDRVKDVITPEAMKKALKDFTAPGSKTVFLNHNTDMPIGVCTKAKQDEKGILVTDRISKAKDVDDVWTKIKEGILNALSIRLSYDKIEVEKDAEGKIIAYNIKEMSIYEHSVVGLPCNASASITSAVEKSFIHAVKGKSSNRSKPKRRKKKMARKKSTTEVVKEVVEETLPSLIAAQMKKIQEQQEEKSKDEKIKELEDKVKELDGEEENEDPRDETIKELEARLKKLEGGEEEELDEKDKTIKELEERLKKLEDAPEGKKGKQDDEEDEEKSIKRPEKLTRNDEDSMKYLVHMWMTNPEEYENLNDAEKQLAKEAYNALSVFGSRESE